MYIERERKRERERETKLMRLVRILFYVVYFSFHFIVLIWLQPLVIIRRKPFFPDDDLPSKLLENNKNNHHKSNVYVFIIKGFRTIVFIFIVISTTFRSICPPAFFSCLSNSGTFTELRTTSFIESTGVACSDSVSHNRVQVLSIPVLLLAYSQD